MNRRDCLKRAAMSAAALSAPQWLAAAEPSVPLAGAAPSARPNIIFCLTDDQGWGDVSYNGNPILKTPHLDEMSRAGIRFDRFYAAYPVCSPTRASVMTGRHPCRYLCDSWGFDLPLTEVTVAEVAKSAGYATGHFGKWHLGGIPEGQGRDGCGAPAEIDPQPRNPGAQGFDEWFSGRNWFDLDPASLYHNGQAVGPLKGDTSDIVMGKALEFIRAQAANRRPFLAYICFPSPHGPWKALEADKAPYAGQKGKADFYGEIAAVDRAMGALRAELRTLGIQRDTMLWFCSDNGAQGGSTGGLSGHKGNIQEGGVRVPGLLEWPARIAQPFRTDVPASTMDFYPTVAELLKVSMSGQCEPLDGISLLPLIDGTMKRRPKPIPFETRNTESGAVTSAALIDNEYKLFRGSGKTAGERLYDLSADPQEQHDIAAERPEVLARMKRQLAEWQASVEKDRDRFPKRVPPPPTRKTAKTADGKTERPKKKQPDAPPEQ